MSGSKADVYEHNELAEKDGSHAVHDVLEFLTIEDEARRRLEKKLVRKLDMTLMPVVWVLYLFNYLDRNNIA